MQRQKKLKLLLMLLNCEKLLLTYLKAWKLKLVSVVCVYLVANANGFQLPVLF